MQMANDTMKAGAGRARIEFPKGFFPFDGFGATGSEEPLYTRLVVFEDAAGARFAFACIEATSLREPMLSDARVAIARITGAPLDAVWLGVTHSFSVPHVRTDAHVASAGERALNVAWRVGIEASVAAAAQEAVDALAPAVLAYGEALCSVNANRDVETPEGWWLAQAGQTGTGFSDHTVRSLVARGVEGDPIALVCAYDVQSSLLDKVRDAAGTKVVSGDVVGTACRMVEEELAPEAAAAAERVRRAFGKRPVCLLAVGAAADQMPAAGAGAGGDALGPAATALAGAIQTAVGAAEPLAFGPVCAMATSLTLAGQEMPANMRDLHPTRSYERVAAPARTTSVHVASIADVPLVGVAPEVSSLMAAQIRAAANAPRTLVFTMINGAEKYLVDSQAYERNTYESMNSGFAAGGAEALVAAAAEGIRTLQDIDGDQPQTEGTQPQTKGDEPQKEA